MKVKVEGEDRHYRAEQIGTLGEKLQAEAGGRKTIILIDEVETSNVTEEQNVCNWTALKRIPKDVLLILIFNPFNCVYVIVVYFMVIGFINC